MQLRSLTGLAITAPLALAVIAARPAVAAERAFLQVETSDVDASEAWYAGAFGLRRVNRFDRPTFEQRILIGHDVILELVESKPAAAAAEGKKLGLSKTGFQVSEFDRKVARWRATGIADAKGLFFDEALGLATVLLRDPDGNIIQIFGKSAGPFDSIVKVSPDFAD